MCGRYVITNPVSKTKKIVKSAIQVVDNENYNAHPYQKLPVIKKYINGNTLENLTWGIIPSWSKKKDFKPLTNARLETIDEKISFKKLIKISRCIAIADGFYEWKRDQKEKMPFYFYRSDKKNIYFARSYNRFFWNSVWNFFRCRNIINSRILWDSKNKYDKLYT